MDQKTLRRHLSSSNLQRLARATKLSRTTLYKVMEAKPTTTATLGKLSSFFENKTANELYQNLKFYGAPLAEKNRRKTLTLEETLLEALKVSRTDSLVESVLPYVLFKNRAVLNLPLLLRESVKSDVDRLLGYYLDVSNQYKPNKTFKNFTHDMRNLFHYETNQPQTLNGKTVKEFALSAYLKNTVALDWGLLVRGELSHYLERFHKWEQLES